MGRARPAFSTSLHFPSTTLQFIIPERVAIKEDRGGFFFVELLAHLAKKGSDGFFFFFCSGKEERRCMQQSSVRPPSAPNASAPSSSSSSSSSSFLGGQSLPEDSKERRRRRRGAHCYIVMGTWAYTLKIQAKKNSNSQLFFFLWCKKTRKRNQCIIPFAPDLEECKTPGAKIKSFPKL